MGIDNGPKRAGHGPMIDLGGTSNEADPLLDSVSTTTEDRLDDYLSGGTGAPRGTNAPIVRSNVIEQPDHLEVPKGAKSLFREGLAYVLQNTDQIAISITAELNQPIVIFAYRMFVDKMGFLSNVPGPVRPPYQFVPMMNDSPNLPNHGFRENNTNFIAPFFPTMDRKTVALNAPNGFDMVVTTPMIRTQIVIPSEQTFSVKCINGGAFDRYMGVELYGYIANGQMDTTKFSSLG